MMVKQGRPVCPESDSLCDSPSAPDPDCQDVLLAELAAVPSPSQVPHSQMSSKVSPPASSCLRVSSGGCCGSSSGGGGCCSSGGGSCCLSYHRPHGSHRHRHQSSGCCSQPSGGLLWRGQQSVVWRLLLTWTLRQEDHAWGQ